MGEGGDAGDRALGVGQGGEVGAGGAAFDAHEDVEGVGRGGLGEGLGEGVGGGADAVAGGGSGVAGGAQQYPAAVADLSGDDRAGDAQACGVGVVEAVLGVTEQDVSLDGAVQAGHVTAASGHPGDGAVVLGAAGDEFGGEVDVAVEDDAVDAAQGQDAASGGVGEVDAYGVVFQAQVGALGLDVEGVEEFGGHASVSWGSSGR